MTKCKVENLIGDGLSWLSVTQFFRMKTHETDLPTYETPPQKGNIGFRARMKTTNGRKNDQPPTPSRQKSPFQIESLAPPVYRRTLFKKDRLLKRREFKRLSRDGKRLVGRRICIDWAKSYKGTRLGITASTHYGNAPERNRFKRLVREAFRLSRAEIPSGIDLNVIPRKLAKDATLTDIKAEFCRLLSSAPC